MACDQGVQIVLAITPCVQKGRPFGSTKPLVTIPNVIGCAQIIERQRHLAGAMGAINQGLNAPGGKLGHEVLYG